VWTKIGQCLEDSSNHCPFPVELVTNRAGQGMVGQGKAAKADTCPRDLLAARSNRLGGLLAVQTSNLHPNKYIYNNKTRIFLKKKIETK